MFTYVDGLLKYKDASGQWHEADVIKGESAYQAAVRLGIFSGTESEYYNKITNDRDSALSQINTKLTEVLSAIDTKKQQTLADIPDDYTTLSGDVSDLKSAFAIFTGQWTDGSRLYTGTGAITESAGWSYMKTALPSDAGVITLTTAARSPAASIVFYDANGDYMQDYTQPGTATLNHTITQTIPEGAAYIGVSCYSANKSVFVCKYLVKESDLELKRMTDPLYNLGNDYLIYKEQKGRRLTAGGETVATTGYVCTNFIPAKWGQYLICGVQPVSPVGAISVACYDASKTFIGYFATRYVQILPAGTAYIRLSHQSDTLDTFKIKLVNAPIRTPYDPLYTIQGTRLSSGGKFYHDVTSGAVTTWFIDVSETPYLILHYEDGSNNGHGAYFYQSDLTFISSTSTYPDSVRFGTRIDVPANAKYMVLNAGDNFNGWQLSPIGSGYRDVYIGPGRKYTSILQALVSEKGSVRFFVDAGTYNVVNEYKAYYGNTFWEDYEGYSGLLDVQLRGYTPDYGQEMHFSPGAEIVFDYAPPSGQEANHYVLEQFSVFNLSIGNVIDGARITFGQRIARYAIHDDMAGGLGTNVIKNCIFNGTSYNGPVIGGGCGLNCSYFLENCVFENNNGYADIMYHNCLTANAINHLHVSNCIGSVGCFFYWCGDSTEVSTFIVSNSKFPTVSLTAHPSPGYVTKNVNVRLIEYCNDKTPVS